MSLDNMSGLYCTTAPNWTMGYTEHTENRRFVFERRSDLTKIIGTFTTHSGEYFLEPLMAADDEEYEEEHNKPHLVYKHERKETRDGDRSEACASSGKDQKQMCREASKSI
ncbi:A disintegrin and metalloproteinase with thrombospondin motifs 20 isoform X1 [Tachysurus ichikawai]